jgi:hypothetical protein
LKTLTLIAYHQPLLQSLLARMIGEAAYEEVQRLRGLGLIHSDPHGATLELRTTRMFAEYFGISTTRPEDIRRFLEQKLGVTPSTLPPAEPEIPPVAEATPEGTASSGTVPPPEDPPVPPAAG